jgi:N-methylhydantoinase B
VLDRELMGRGSTVRAPAVVEFGEATCLIRPGWGGVIDFRRHARPEPGAGMTLDPITLSVMRGALEGVAAEMGSVLVHSAYSSNIKERRDCSAALFDDRGRMVAQAEHIPVHLGAMPEAVAAAMARGAQPGDVFALNDPYTGGTHLPDITLVSPIAVRDRPVGYAVTRAHHSDVGGMVPGSMPSGSRDLWQEGLVIPPVRVVRGGRLDEDLFALILANSRTPRLRRGDLAGADRRQPDRRRAADRSRCPPRA